MPIREKIVERRGATVITRNSYGARCLDTPNVLVADIDAEPALLSWMLSAEALAALGVGAYGWWRWNTLVAGIFMWVIAFFVMATAVHIASCPNRRPRAALTRAVRVLGACSEQLA